MSVHHKIASLLNTSSKNSYNISGLRGSSVSWFTAQLNTKKTLCFIVPNEQAVPNVTEDLHLFSQTEVISYPGYEIPPYTPLSPDQKTTAQRLSALYHLHENKKPLTVVVSIEALMRRVIPKSRLTGRTELIMAGEDIDLESLVTSLVGMGYEQVSLVRSVGDFSLRGGILDVFPPAFFQEDGSSHNGPLRLDFFGDTVESLRSFDIFTQRSDGELTEAILLPVNDIVYPASNSKCSEKELTSFRDASKEFTWDKNQAKILLERVQNIGRFAGAEFFLPCFYGNETNRSTTFFDYLPSDNTLFVISDPEGCRKTMTLVNERIEANYTEVKEKGLPTLPPSHLFLDTEHIEQAINTFSTLHLTDFVSPDAPNSYIKKTTNHQLLKQEISLHRKKRGLIAPLIDTISNWQNGKEKIVICCRSSRHTKNLAELLSKRGMSIEQVQCPLQIDSLNSSSVFLCDHPLTEGFSLPEENVHVLSESELFGEMRIGAKSKKRVKDESSLSFAEISEGDIIVHRDHGLGMYHGIVTMELQNVKNDYIHIEYRDGDKLYLPVDRMNLVTKYEGLSDKTPKIDKLGSQAWKTVTTKVKEEVWKTAQELLDIYAAREIRKGKKFSNPAELYHELEESFPYDETPGQDRAITEVISDLTSDKPMDRLVCGDVGYGKTEVAIRAAFKVVEDGFQAAILVPTTVLSEQHLKTFRERLQGFPITIECINRFRTTSEQKKIIFRLKNGDVDIVIGTHRLLSKDVCYKNLGLLIVDEEHRFGVTHKEKIKKIKAEVDILTLTATPIPRTLQMSLLGIRDLSVISSPPEHRLPVKTFVARYDDLVIKEAITREMQRKGQTFIVYNRVKSIHKMASTVQKLVPEARVAVAHGQMAGKELEQIMVRFVNKEIDVLIATTIIESGIDIPSANTIIINRADMLGLAEIYQLRGRVGRSSMQSFAYLLVPSMDTLSRDSKERLRALMDYNELGGGFKLAMSDLQIRGGGNLLGVSQSGHIASIGYDLYLELLQKTVADLKNRGSNTQGESAQDDIDPEINLQISAYIPESYIPDIDQRYIAYRRISTLTGQDDLRFQDLQDELEDRYGSLPNEVKNLFATVALKRDLSLLRVNKLEKGKNTLVFSFLEDTSLQPNLLFNYLEKREKKEKRNPSRLLPDGRLVLSGENDKSEDVFENCRQILTDLKSLSDA